MLVNLHMMQVEKERTELHRGLREGIVETNQVECYEGQRGSQVFAVSAQACFSSVLRKEGNPAIGTASAFHCHCYFYCCLCQSACLESCLGCIVLAAASGVQHALSPCSPSLQ